EFFAALERRSGEPWYEDAYAAIRAWAGGEDTPENRIRAAPFMYGRWNDEMADHSARRVRSRSAAAAEGFYGDGVFDPARTRAAIAGLDAPVLVVAGDLDPAVSPAGAAGLAALFPNGLLNVDP